MRRTRPEGPARPAWFGEIQRPPAQVPEAAGRPAPPLFDDENRPIATPEGWARRREALRARWMEFLRPADVPRQAPVIHVEASEVLDGVLRQLVRYEAEPGLWVRAYVLSPAVVDGQARPGVVVLHSTTEETIRQPAGLAGTPDKHIGLHLARRGMVAVCPRCFLWEYGEPKKLTLAVERLNERHPGMTGMAKMLADASRAIDVLERWPGVDPARIGAIGHSLGAKEVLYLSAFDERVKASVSSEGGIGLDYSNWEAPWYLGEAIKRPGFPLDHGQVLALSAPRPFLLIGGDSADGAASWPYIEAVRPVWELTGSPEAVGLFNHGQGHAFPPVAQARSYEWLAYWLGR